MMNFKFKRKLRAVSLIFIVNVVILFLFGCSDNSANSSDSAQNQAAAASSAATMDTTSEVQGKQQKTYTWEEFEALTDAEKEEFYESFSSNDDFDKWMTEAKKNADSPWIAEGRSPKDYTWSEYEALTDTQKELFYDSFSSNDDFDKWITEAKKKADSPWTAEGRSPKDYTWSEFEALTDTQKELFYESFDSNQEFDKWMKQAQENN